MSMADRPPVTGIPRLARRASGTSWSERSVPEEVPVALSFSGTTHAVMMASPSDLEDFALGFALTEGIIGAADEVERMHIEHLETGIDIQMWLRDKANTRFVARRRRLAGPVGCGLCGIESIEEAVRAVSKVSPRQFSLSVDQVGEAMRLLAKHQPLHAETGAVHAAGFFLPGKGIALVREDVGRHNALDKLIGHALLRGEVPLHNRGVIVSGRASFELMQKSKMAGVPLVAAVGAPSSLAVELAREFGITLVGFLKTDRFNVYSRPDRIF
jgi:FdhD protein